MFQRLIFASILSVVLMIPGAWAAENLKPFILVSNAAGDAAAAVNETKGKLEAGGFKIVGEYSPYVGANVIVVTSDDLLTVAGKTKFGGYGSVVRVSVTQVGDKVQVAYANPEYWGAAYQMEDMSGIASALTKALGAGTPFGSKEGLSESRLRKYHYMAFMPYFKDHDELGDFDSHEAAVAKVNERLAKGVKGMSKVFEVSIPGKNETLIGVAITEGDGADKFIMEKVDKEELKHTPHLPYAVLISDKDVYALAGKFRIALSFPDLTMGGFAGIMSSPAAIKDTLGELAED